MNIYDFVKFLTNFKKQTTYLKQNLKPYFTMLKRIFTKFVNRKIAVKSPFLTMYEFKTHILRILKKQTANLKQI